MPDPMYLAYLIVGAGRALAWERAKWAEAVAVLDPLVGACEGDVGVRSSQIDRKTRREARFGRLGWNAKSHEKWTLEKRGLREFYSTEVWCPRWTQCEREGRDPDVLILLENPHIVGKPLKGQFNQLLLLAVTHQLAEQRRTEVESALQGLNELMGGVATFVRSAPWNNHGDCVQDVLTNHFSYEGLHEDLVPDATKLAKEGWTACPSGASIPASEVPQAPPGFLGEVFAGPSAPACELAPGPVVYDKAKYHYGGEYPEDLPNDQAFVHTGMFLGWLIDAGLTSQDFDRETSEGIRDFRDRKLTGPGVYQEWDGCLVDDMLSEEGNRFAAAYFDFEVGEYLNDYLELLGEDLPSLYHVDDTWENYDLLKARIDQRYRDWQASRIPG